MKDTYLVLQEDFERLFNHYRPGTIKDANDWLLKYVTSYNSRPLRETLAHQSHIDAWEKGLPPNGYRKVCDIKTFKSYLT